jgi:hypothetical protein
LSIVDSGYHEVQRERPYYPKSLWYKLFYREKNISWKKYTSRDITRKLNITKYCEKLSYHAMTRRNRYRGIQAVYLHHAISRRNRISRVNTRKPCTTGYREEINYPGRSRRNKWPRAITRKSDSTVYRDEIVYHGISRRNRISRSITITHMHHELPRVIYGITTYHEELRLPRGITRGRISRCITRKIFMRFHAAHWMLKLLSMKPWRHKARCMMG